MRLDALRSKYPSGRLCTGTRSLSFLADGPNERREGNAGCGSLKVFDDFNLQVEVAQ